MLVRIALALTTATLLIGGCPPTDGTGGSNSPARAVIGVSAERGPAPLRVSLTSEDSNSTAGEIDGVTWELGDGSTSAQRALFHTYTLPGLYTVRLTVVDAAGNTDTDVIQIQAQGGPASVEIAATPTGGKAPISIAFSASATLDDGDSVRDYFWEFDDGQTSRQAAPPHFFEEAGDYEVTLRIVTAGGSEATDSILVPIAEGDQYSLQFGSGQFITLPISTAPLAEWTFEAWMSPDATGGALASFGSPSISIEASPLSSQLRLRNGATSSDVSAALSTGRWQHVAATYTAATGVVFYVNGALAGSAAAAGSVSLTELRGGAGFSGKLARLRFWSVARSASDIAANYDRFLRGLGTGLLGDWPTTEGSGQVVGNEVSSAADGALGSSSAAEASDPAWSTDHP